MAALIADVFWLKSQPDLAETPIMSRRRRRRSGPMGGHGEHSPAAELLSGRPPQRSTGTVVCHESGDRWTVELRLEEAPGDPSRLHTILLSRPYATKHSARLAGEQIVRDWQAGNVTIRDLMLAELAARYRKLRETHSRMNPPTVPTTRSSWEAALTGWVERGWITPDDAQHLREHVTLSLDPESGLVHLTRRSVADDESSLAE